MRLKIVGQVLMAGAVAAACSRSADGPVVLSAAGAGGKAGVSMDSVAPHTPWIFMTDSVCARGKGSATPLRVELVRPTGSMRLMDWGLRAPADSAASGGPPAAGTGTVSKYPEFTHAPIVAGATPCADDNDAPAYLLDVSVESSDAAITTASGLTLVYRSGGHTHTTYLPFYLTLCASKTCPPVVLSR